MRCLYCDKKLSLLKLAKGDSFCSAEHFDAHQLRVSKSAFEHLISPGIDETLRAPMMLKPHGEEKQTPPPTLHPPPYAPFSMSPLIPFPPSPAFLIADGPDVPRPKMAFPVHDVEFTACLLNLYLQLSRSEITPFNWELAHHLIASPMDFRPNLNRPPLALSPDFPEIEDPAEPEPIETAPPVAPRLPFLLAPSFGERTTQTNFLDIAPFSVPKRPTLAPILAPRNSLRPDSSGAIPKSILFAQAPAPQVQDVRLPSIHIGSELALPPNFILPAAKGQSHLDGLHVASLLIRFTGAAFETSWQSIRSLEFDSPNPGAPLVCPDAVLIQSLRPPRIPSTQRPASLPTNPISPKPISMGKSPRPNEPHRASPVPPAAGTPQKWAAILPSSPLVSVLETRPLQRELVFVHLPVCPIEFGLRTIMAEFPAEEPPSLADWRNQAPHSPLPERIADATQLPALKLEPLLNAPPCLKKNPSRVQPPALTNQPGFTIAWHEFHSGIHSGASPEPAVAPPPLRFSAPDTSRKLEMASGVALPPTQARVFVPAPRVLFAALDVASSGSPALPQIVGDPAGSVKIGLGAPSAIWEPRQAASPGPRITKFLPVRKGPVLPAARNWPRLGSLPR